jgi:hypothetical protein
MEFDVERVAPADRYELLLSTVVPRPIAAPDGKSGHCRFKVGD